MAEVISTVGVTFLLVAYWAESRDRIKDRSTSPSTSSVRPLRRSALS
jgi:hypothetical protein